MKLIVHELTGAGLEQIVTPTKNTIVVAVRPHLYRHNFATGSLKVQVLTEGDVLINESETVDIADIGEMDFFHGYVRFDVSAYLAKDTAYKIKLVGGDGYTFDDSAYCGWANGFDLQKYPTNEAPSNSFEYPFDLEIWERTEK
jgi:hypothetical protein